MSLKGEDKKKYMQEYNPKYYEQKRQEILNYRKKRRAKDNENLKNFRLRQLNTLRKKKIRLGEIYTNRKHLRIKNPYS